MFRRSLMVLIAIAFVGLVALRIWRYATFEQQAINMPSAVVDAEEQELFLEPAGMYSSADIAANGNLLPSQKFRDFRPRHDFRPQPGDLLCPITRTKAHRQCSWIVNGQSYEFCCPPCIAEFVRQAKEHPELIQPPEAYILQRPLNP